MLRWRGQTIKPDKFKVLDKINTRLSVVKFKLEGHRYYGVQCLSDDKTLVLLDKLKAYFGLCKVGTVVIKHTKKYRIVYNVSNCTPLHLKELEFEPIKQVYLRYVIWAHLMELKINLSLFRNEHGHVICIGEVDGVTKDSIVKYLPAESVIKNYVLNIIQEPTKLQSVINKFPAIKERLAYIHDYYA